MNFTLWSENKSSRKSRYGGSISNLLGENWSKRGKSRIL